MVLLVKNNPLKAPLLAAVLIILLAFTCARITKLVSATNVTGIVSSNVNWTLANSPYNLTGNVLVDSGVTVTIEAGTVVNFNSYFIRVNGTLLIQPGVVLDMSAVASNSIQVNGVMTARGTNANPIRVYGGSGYVTIFGPAYFSSITFSDLSSGWNEQAGTGSIMENVIVNSTIIEIKSSVKIANDTFVNNAGISILSGSPVITKNSITGPISMTGGSSIISNNTIKNGYVNFYGDSGGENASITDNIISDATSLSGINAGIWFLGSWGSGGHVEIQRNLITNNYYGIYIFNPNFNNINTALTIQNNTIVNNTIGIALSNPYTPTIIYNNIYNNQTNLQLNQGANRDINASYNWWGSTNSTLISQGIIDFNDNFDLGRVTFAPFLTAPNNVATPMIPENFLAWAILTMLVVSALASVTIRKKKAAAKV
jgi:parallel beta-helix repeat protein